MKLLATPTFCNRILIIGEISYMLFTNNYITEKFASDSK